MFGQSNQWNGNNWYSKAKSFIAAVLQAVLALLIILIFLMTLALPEHVLMNDHAQMRQSLQGGKRKRKGRKNVTGSDAQQEAYFIMRVLRNSRSLVRSEGSLHFFGTLDIGLVKV